MAVKKKKMSDGLFVWEQVSITSDNFSQEDAQALEDLFDNIRNPESQLNGIEARINDLIKKSEKRISNQGSNKELRKYHEKYKEINQVKDYAENALRYLKQARDNLNKHDTGQAVVDTIYMMDAYWRGFIHTEKIKTSIIRDGIHTKPKKRGGDMTGKKKEYEAKPEHDRINQENRLLKQNLSATRRAEIVKEKLGLTLSIRQITNIFKEDSLPEKTS